ncbi:hypothetical protein [Streptomyces sp. NPDC058307]|uniref:DUF3885 domain-containing protein n=1 Tax=Streptomyces sp. NPDC058307 TaxID=3346439 RepID=UPI0036E35EFC
MTSADDAEHLSALWQRQWPQGPPVAHELRGDYPDRRRERSRPRDAILREVNDVLAGVFVTDTGMRRIHHPYAGGADVVLASAGERDRLREQFGGWVSPHASGL